MWAAVAERSRDTAFGLAGVFHSVAAFRFPPRSQNQ